MTRYVTFLFWIVVCVASLRGQSRSVIVGINYFAPQREGVSPGQLVTLQVRGLSAPDSQANRLPLPLELSGVTAIMEEPLMGYRKSMPILRIDSVGCGFGFIFVCDYKAVTVQVPVDLRIVPAAQRAPIPTITLSENGVRGFSAEFIMGLATVRILNDCLIISKAVNASCAAIATHADGSPLTASNPGRKGEVIVLYALGLGITSPVVPEGQAAPVPAPTTTVDLRATFSAEFIPYPIPDSTWIRPAYSGLVSGFAGLYQVNLRLPDVMPPGVYECDGPPGNLIITLAGGGTSDFGKICVQR